MSNYPKCAPPQPYNRTASGRSVVGKQRERQREGKGTGLQSNSSHAQRENQSKRKDSSAGVPGFGSLYYRSRVRTLSLSPSVGRDYEFNDGPHYSVILAN